jgi:glycosyltransferase involved in cell wall biosynthesis
VFILPSETESFGLSALEAMSLGVPVVATSIGGLPELIRDKIDGFLHPIGDIDSMARSVSHLLEDKDLRSRMSASSRKRAFDSFGEKPIIDAYEAIYNRVLSNK